MKTTITNEQDKKHLQDLIKIYLTTEDVTEQSIEFENIKDSSHIVFWIFNPEEALGTSKMVPIIDFIINYLLQPMYAGKLFKFNKIMSQGILKGTMDTNFIQIIWDSHLEMQKAEKHSAKTIKKNKRTSPK